jgi:hypothetical protein
MLEKVAGCCLVDKLRSILLMEADYNTNNKEMIETGCWRMSESTG